MGFGKIRACKDGLALQEEENGKERDGMREEEREEIKEEKEKEILDSFDQ